MTPAYDMSRTFAYQDRRIPAMMQDDIREAMIGTMPKKRKLSLPHIQKLKDSCAEHHKRLREKRAKSLRNIIAMLEEGMSNREIAESLALSRHHVNRMIREAKEMAA